MKRIIIVFSLLSSLSFYGQNDTISVVRHTDNDFVIPKELKLVYRGIPNEIFIDVPKAKSFEVSGNGITKVSNNIYKLIPGAGLETVVSVDIVLKDNKKVSEKHVFKIRNVRTPITCFNFSNKDSIISLQKQQIKNGIVRVISGDKNLNFTFKVTKFKINIPGVKTIEINGDKIDDKTFEQINKYSSRGDLISIFNVSILMKPSFNGCILIRPMLIKVL